MCGIAGYDLGEGSAVAPTLAAQALLAGIAERGADAVGFAHRSTTATVTIHKQRTGATELLDAISLPDSTRQALIHVRDYTKGHPRVLANNHPIRHGAIVGIHNGIIENDDALFTHHGIARAARSMTVDSEVIFALVNAYGASGNTLEQLHGAMATAWVDERDGHTLWLARGVARPLWLGRGRNDLFFASTRAALEVVERTLRIGLRKTEVREGRLLRIENGHVAQETRWRTDASYRETNPLPTVRAPHEGARCLERLAAIAALV